MRILHIIDDMAMGGANALLVDLAPAQMREGHNVDILQLIESKDKTLTNKLAGTGVNVISLKKNGSFYSPIFIFKIIPILKKYDIVHVHLFPALYWAGFAKLLSYSKTPFVYTEHSTSNKRRNKPVLLAVDKFVYSNCYKEIIACSDKALETYKSVFPNVNTCTIPNGVDISKNINATPYSKQNLVGIDVECFVTTMIARFASMKRQDTVVEAISKLPSNFHAVFVGGDGGELQRVKDLVKSLDVVDRIHFLGIRPDVPQILKSSDVVIMASDYEGLSLSSIEGMASGRPFVASNVNGLREVVSGAGELFENKNPDALADILRRLQSDNAFYNEVVHKCQMRAKLFDIKACSQSYLEIYKKYVQ